MPFKNNKKQRITATAAPDAMKVSGLANEVIAAPANAEERLLKVCVRRTPLELAWRRIKIGLTVLRGIGQGVNSNVILNTKFKALYVAVCG